MALSQAFSNLKIIRTDEVPLYHPRGRTVAARSDGTIHSILFAVESINIQGRHLSARVMLPKRDLARLNTMRKKDMPIHIYMVSRNGVQFVLRKCRIMCAMRKYVSFEAPQQADEEELEEGEVREEVDEEKTEEVAGEEKTEEEEGEVADEEEGVNFIPLPPPTPPCAELSTPPPPPPPAPPVERTTWVRAGDLRKDRTGPSFIGCTRKHPYVPPTSPLRGEAAEERQRQAVEEEEERQKRAVEAEEERQRRAVEAEEERKRRAVEAEEERQRQAAVEEERQRQAALEEERQRQRRVAEAEEERKRRAVATAEPAAPPRVVPRARVVRRSRYSTEVEYRGIVFRSILEARHACLFDCLNLRWSYESLSFCVNDPFGKDKVWYKPDFFLPDLALIVEIKPAEPYMEQLIKCENVADMGVTDVALFHGKIKDPALSAFAAREANYTYDHDDGLRVKLWTRGGTFRAGAHTAWVWPEGEPHARLASFQNFKDVGKWVGSTDFARVRMAFHVAENMVVDNA